MSAIIIRNDVGIAAFIIVVLSKVLILRLVSIIRYALRPYSVLRVQIWLLRIILMPNKALRIILSENS